MDNDLYENNLINNINIPKVSVVLPSLNVKDYIADTIESVLNQSLTDIEIICVDAGSTDGTYEIIEQYANKDSRIKIIKSEKRSYGYQVNLGIVNSNGEYVGIVETDDIIKCRMYENLYKKAKETGVDVIKADFCKFYINDGELIQSEEHITKDNLYDKVLNHNEDYKSIITEASLYTWAGLYKRSFLLKNKIKHNESPGASYQDNGFWFLTMTLAHSVYFVRDSYYMLRRDNPNSSVYSTEKIYAIFDEYDYVKGIISKWKNADEIWPLYWWARFGACRYHYRRIGRKYKKKYIIAFQKSLIEASKEGRIDTDLFSKTSFSDYMSIVNNPIKYNRDYLREQKEEMKRTKKKSNSSENQLMNLNKTNKSECGLNCTARIDILGDNLNCDEINFISISDTYNKHYIIGAKHIVESNSNCIEIKIKCKKATDLSIKLRGICLYSKNKSAFPLFVDFTRFWINDDLIFCESKVVSHDKPYVYTKKGVLPEEIIRVYAEWKTVDNSSVFDLYNFFGIQKKEMVNKNSSVSTSNIPQSLHARIDVKNRGTMFNNIIYDSSSEGIDHFFQPKSFKKKDGSGAIYEFANHEASLSFKCENAGMLELELKCSRYVHDGSDEGIYNPSIVYKKLVVNGKLIFDEDMTVSYLNPFLYTVGISDEEMIFMYFEWSEK